MTKKSSIAVAWLVGILIVSPAIAFLFGELCAAAWSGLHEYTGPADALEIAGFQHWLFVVFAVGYVLGLGIFAVIWRGSAKARRARVLALSCVALFSGGLVVCMGALGLADWLYHDSKTPWRGRAKCMDSQHETAGWLSLGVKAADIGEAIVFFARAAEGGHLLAMLNLGEILCRRLEPEEAAAGKSYRDCSRGVVWLEKVARSGGPDAAEAQCRLGAAFSDETSDICDYAKAVFWYEQCADTCDEAAYELGMIYLEGRLGVPDYPAAEAWLRKAADSGSCRACYQLGMIAENGLTAFPDSVQAVKYYKKGSYGSPECAEALRRLGIP